MVLEYGVNTVNEDPRGLLEGVYISNFLYRSAVTKLAADCRPDLVLVGLFI